ncbi:hypothetical protein MLD38_030737 [Melastoma candidum]|uniref:Uncharacterized protein n=1 Tax=Melastoma candidum TaxID=119954 RepID=A0ACB9MML4_9MYRT|nr:hypothetical protein MLD38_030737 [Melastoma candidum]
MFLMEGSMPLALLWEWFFDGYGSMFYIYIHSHPANVAEPGYAVNMIVAEWGMVMSRVQLHGLIHRIWTLWKRAVQPEYGPPEVNLNDWRKGSQWFEVIRKLALEIASDTWFFLGDLTASNMESNREKGNGKQKIVEVGLWGGHGGSSWDDGYYDGVREIAIAFGHCIDSIQVVYDKNGKAIVAEKHGGVGGSHTAEIKLQWPDEYITCVSGHYCPVVLGGSPVIRSITIRSNKRTFGPFGVEEGMPFIFPLEGLRIVGLKGRGGWFLDAIGFHVTRARPTKMLQRVHKTFRRLTSTTA